MPHLSLPQPQDRFGVYRLLLPLGQGGMASVFVAEAEAGEHKGKRVACKMLLPHLNSDPRWRAQLFAEANTTAAVKHHNVIRVLDIPQDPEAGFFVMEWREGLPLDRLLATTSKLELRVACAVLAQTAHALAAAHAAHVVHRDVSPHNIHVGTDGVVKLLDFGIAATMGHARLTRTGEFKGKLAYVAPEQITRSHAIDFRCDLWALGLVAYEVLTGRCLFAADDEATTLWNVTAAEVPSLASLGCQIDPALSAVIEACLQRDPQLRPARAQDVAMAFERFAGDLRAIAALVRPQAAPLLAEPRRPAARRRLLLLGGGLATVAAAAWLAIADQPRKNITKQKPAAAAPAAMHAPPSAVRALSPSGMTSPAIMTPAVTKRRPAARPPARPPATQRHPDLVPNPYKDLVDNPY